MFNFFGKLIIGVSMFVTGLFGHQTQPAQQPILGATIPVVVTRFQTSLQSSITSAATAMTLVSGTDVAGNALSGYTCFTIDEGTSVAEDVCGSASGTAVTAMIRGISPTTGSSSVASLEFAHRRGASVKITDAPQLPIISRILNGNETLPNILVYDSSVASSTIGLNLQNVASVAYVNSVAVAGAPNASAAAKGIVQAATTAQVINGTGSGSTGALLFAPNSLYNTTSSAATLIPVTQSNGKLSQGFLDLTQAFTFTGNLSLATTTISSTTITGVLNVNSSSATSTFNIPPIFTASTTQPTQAATKQYVDSKFSFATTTSPGNFAGATSTLSYTPSVASRALVIFKGDTTNSSSGGTCVVTLTIDGVVQTSSQYTNTAGNSGGGGELSFDWVTSQLSASAHNVSVSNPGTNNCSFVHANQFSILNIGN